MTAEGIYDTEDSGFVFAMQRCIADLCDATAGLQVSLKKELTDSAGRYIEDVEAAEKFRAFVFSLERLYRYSREILPADVTADIEAFVDAAKIRADLPANNIEKGLEAANKLQQCVHELGLKNTSAGFDIFDFEFYYLTERGDQNEQTESASEDDFDILDSDNGIDIVGFPQKSEFSYMFTHYSNRTFYLLSSGRVDDAMSFFYNILGDFAPVFDDIFLNNCINISKTFFAEKKSEKENEIRRTVLSKSEYYKMYQLHKAQFSRLMVRAHVLLQPDIYDNRFPDYEPAQQPGGV